MSTNDPTDGAPNEPWMTLSDFIAGLVRVLAEHGDLPVSVIERMDKHETYATHTAFHGEPVAGITRLDGTRALTLRARGGLVHNMETGGTPAIERVWICGCGERISLRRRGQNARAAVARHRKMVREHLAAHRGNPCAPPTPTPPARDDLSPYVRQGLVADAVMRLTREDLLAAAAAHPDSIHVVHDSVSIDLPAKDPK